MKRKAFDAQRKAGNIRDRVMRAVESESVERDQGEPAARLVADFVLAFVRSLERFVREREAISHTRGYRAGMREGLFTGAVEALERRTK